jgi:MATE family multidrug resistance protein
VGTVALTAQALGAGDTAEERAVLARALLIAGTIGVVLIAAQGPVAWAVFGLMGGSSEVRQAAEVYFGLRIWSAPLALGNYVLLGWLVGLARATTALALQITINVVNIAATLLLVLGLGLGVAGVALASVAAEAVGIVVALPIASRLLGGRLSVDLATVLHRPRLLRMLGVNRDIMIRTAALICAFGFFTAQGARSGDTTLAANAVLVNFMLFGAFCLEGFGTAAQQLGGRAVGAHDRLAFGQTVRLVLGWALAVAVVTSAALAAGGGALIDAMTKSPEVRAMAREFLAFAALAPVAGVFAYTFDGIYVGATWARDMRNLMILALAVYFLAWWSLRGLGNAGLWSTLLIFLLARGFAQAIRYPTLERATFGAGRR